eukprot:m.13054 g.13054  ORF g.13054 m.13054 type:complete len:272 (+) comp8267_c0_seq1:134-949(+)
MMFTPQKYTPLLLLVLVVAGALSEKGNPSKDCKKSCRSKKQVWVCDQSTGVSWQKKCWAKCEGVDDANLVDGRCPEENSNNVDDCLADCSGKRKKKVCGDDGVTYKNTCEAKCHGISSWTSGKCAAKPTKAECLATCDSKKKNSVCGEDGKTYRNGCAAKCYSVAFTKGACPEEGDNCEEKCLNEPRKRVCGDKTTYDNRCLAECAGAQSIKNGKCQKRTGSGCALCNGYPKDSPRVCSEEGVSFKNKCHALCRGVVKVRELDSGEKCKKW